MDVGWYFMAEDSIAPVGPYKSQDACVTASVVSQRLLALDRASARRYSKDGHLHLDTTNISKAAVNEYWGREIPNFDKLGLDPEHKYKLFRDPEELARAAPTFNNKPILSEHMPVSADEYPAELVIGTTGSNSKFDGGYLKNSLAIWKGDDIRKIESDKKKQLSSGYRYRADMTPGSYQGQPYDGVMRDIVGNHVAVVEEGRAGPDVVVGDAAMVKFEQMFSATPQMSQLFAADVKPASYDCLFSRDEQERDKDGKFAGGAMRAHAESKGWKPLHPAGKEGASVHKKGKGNFLHVHNSGEWSHERGSDNEFGAYTPTTSGSGSGLESLKKYLK